MVGVLDFTFSSGDKSASQKINTRLPRGFIKGQLNSLETINNIIQIYPGINPQVYENRLATKIPNDN
jgi:hypothetical protein